MIPMCLVTGFLGSGKTTLLKMLDKRFADRNVVFLVNEFAAGDVDGALLGTEDDGVFTITGGSIFCVCRVEPFLDTLRALPAHFERLGRSLDGVVVEASGMANPMIVDQLLAETGLAATYRLQTIVSIIDPGSFTRLLETLPNITAQIKAADIVLINKVDLYGEASVADAEAKLRQINGRVHVGRTEYCNTSVDIFGDVPQRELQGELVQCRDSRYHTADVRHAEAVNVESLRRRLVELGEGLYRAKGFVQTAAGPQYVDYSAAGFSAAPVNGFAGRPRLALIGAEAAADDIDRLANDVRRGALAEG
jgi:G3E family GTPase